MKTKRNKKQLCFWVPSQVCGLKTTTNVYYFIYCIVTTCLLRYFFWISGFNRDWISESTGELTVPHFHFLNQILQGLGLGLCVFFNLLVILIPSLRRNYSLELFLSPMLFVSALKLPLCCQQCNPFIEIIHCPKVRKESNCWSELHSLTKSFVHPFNKYLRPTPIHPRHGSKHWGYSIEPAKPLLSFSSEEIHKHFVWWQMLRNIKQEKGSRECWRGRWPFL